MGRLIRRRIKDFEEKIETLSGMDKLMHEMVTLANRFKAAHHDFEEGLKEEDAPQEVVQRVKAIHQPLLELVSRIHKLRESHIKNHPKPEPNAYKHAFEIPPSLQQLAEKNPEETVKNSSKIMTGRVLRRRLRISKRRPLLTLRSSSPSKAQRILRTPQRLLRSSFPRLAWKSSPRLSRTALLRLPRTPSRSGSRELR